MKLKYKRFNFLIIFILAIASTIFFVLKALEEKIVFFYSPTEILNKDVKLNDTIRVGGLVVDNSIVYDNGGLEVFLLLLTKKTHLIFLIKVFCLILFREGQGIVAEGNIDYSKKYFFSSKGFSKT